MYGTIVEGSFVRVEKGVRVEGGGRHFKTFVTNLLKANPCSNKSYECYRCMELLLKGVL